MTISELLVVSDLDGTIVPISGKISRKNLEALDKFRALGGTFTVATGRSPVQAKDYLTQLGVEGAMIANNGAVIYDCAKNENIWVTNFESSYQDIVNEIKTQFPQIGIVAISSLDQYHVIVNSPLVALFATMSNVLYETITDTVFPTDCCKVLFGVENADLKRLNTFLADQKYDEVQFVCSGEYCIEMMPKDISKGYTLEKLVEIYGKTLAHTVAIGDYNNDIEMLKKAGIGVAVANALDEVKEVASLVVKRCDEDGLADLIEYLIQNIDKL